MVNKYSYKTQGNLKLSTNFTVKEFRCKNGADEVLIDNELVQVLQTIRDHYKKPILINSAHRTVAYNKSIGGSSQSQHCKGTAADIRIEGIEPLQLALYIKSLPFFKNRGGIGLYDRSAGIYAGFVHVDVRTYKSRWISKVGTTYISTPELMPILKKGMRDGGTTSYAVTVLQRHLGIKNPDGVFGTATETAVIAWQKNHGLTADGIVGEKTWLTL